GRYYNSITIKKLKDKEAQLVKNLPEKALLSNFSWSQDYSKLAFTNQVTDGIELWILDISQGQAKKVTSSFLHDVLGGSPYIWLRDGSTFIVKLVSEDRGELLSSDRVPTGPIVQENLGKTAPVRTYRDLLESEPDAKNFEYFTKSKIAKVGIDGKVENFLPTAQYSEMSLSPDGKYLMVKTIHRPFSYLVPYYRFPTKTEIVNVQTGIITKTLLEAPLEEETPKGFMSTTSQPRNHHWRADEPSTVYWVEALDGGDPEVEVPYRDALYLLRAPFNGKKQEVMKTLLRFRNVRWGNQSLAIVEDYWWNTRVENTYIIDPSNPKESKPLFTRNTEDIYSDPGNFVMKNSIGGYQVLLSGKGNKSLYLMGEGYSPEGNKPFIDEFDIKKRGSKRLWRSDGISTYESIIDVLNIEQGTLITTIESKNINPNFYVRDIKTIKSTQITFFKNPYESLSGVKQELIQYKRKDGVDLTAVLYLPADYKPGTRLPAFLWAYPREFKDAKSAGMVKDSPHRFIRLSYGSPIFWAAMGYAVLDRTDFPIIGEGENEPNDTFVQQLINNAEAAIDEMDKRGIVDPQRIGVGGHSYGAFMTANLLAHSDLFAAGIARSGAYNRTLTPFGFQREERTFWEAPEIYFQMSPFMHAHKINEPMLMIHGTHDNNSGTFPIQSDRMYAAIKGHGGTTRLVKLPYESHGYAARESVMHMLWEMNKWLETYVKNKEKIPQQKLDTSK
ncbi:MAG: prolyl oligopeptidase family serine peptidase, partial [Cyclobacteriaceae bacterium]|nr:prolyl oligopeptidase family serine peptidase [Cyclobacteriaceae bacterium]